MSAARLIHLESTPSTMVEAAALASAGEPHGTVVVANRQTAGIGRHGHAWHSDDQGGLYFSMVLRLGIAPEKMPVLTMALGLAAQAAVNDLAQVAADLRWPNDLLLNEKKLAGILVQAAGNASVAGIGLNVNQQHFPEDLKQIATSLVLETGREFSKDMLLERVRVSIQQYLDILTERGRREILRLFTQRSSYAEGKAVEVDLGTRVIRGISAGLDEQGFLLVQTPQGRETVLAGGVRPATS